MAAAYEADLGTTQARRPLPDSKQAISQLLPGYPIWLDLEVVSSLLVECQVIMEGRAVCVCIILN